MKHLFACLIGLWFLIVPAFAQEKATAIRCNAAAIYDTATSGAVKLINAPQTGGIYICGFMIAPVTVTFGTGVSFVYSTATFASPTINLQALSPAITPQFQWTTITNGSVVDSSSAFRGLYVPPGNNVYLSTGSATSSIKAILYYFQQQQ